MQMMANGGVGGGVASAVARALGAGKPDEAAAVLWHAVLLSIVFGIAFTVLPLVYGPWLYRSLGGEGGALSAALSYSNTLFLGATLAWVMALLASALRGAGNVAVPAYVTLGGAVILVPLSPALIFGVGPVPAFGVAGAGIAIIVYYALATVVFVTYLRSSRSPLPLRITRFEWRFVSAIMRVGGLSAIGTVMSNLTVVLVTGSVGLYGTKAIAGYGIASRLDYLLIPLLFGIGSAAVTIIGANVGAGQAKRARHIAWVTAAIGVAMTGIIGILAAIFPNAWSGLFTSDPEVLAVSAQYLRIVGPSYMFFGAAMMLYFCSQGAGRMIWPVSGGAIRMVIAGGVSWVISVKFGVDLHAVYWNVAFASVVFCAVTVFAVSRKNWGQRFA